MDNCIFCKIISKEIPSNTVYEDDQVIAFHDINPAAPVHVLIVPKIHLDNLNGIDESNSHVVAHVHIVAKKVAEKLGIANLGYRIVTNCGENAGQTVFHLHFHLLGGKHLGTKIL